MFCLLTYFDTIIFAVKMISIVKRQTKWIERLCYRECCCLVLIEWLLRGSVWFWWFDDLWKNYRMTYCTFRIIVIEINLGGKWYCGNEIFITFGKRKTKHKSKWFIYWFRSFLRVDSIWGNEQKVATSFIYIFFSHISCGGMSLWAFRKPCIVCFITRKYVEVATGRESGLFVK